MMDAGTLSRLFFGFLFQVVPFGILAIYPFWNKLRITKKGAVALIVGSVVGIAAAFAISGCYLQSILPGDATLFNAVNVVFLICLIPCLVIYLTLVRASWQEKLFVFTFALTCAWSITATTDIAFTIANRDGSFDGLPYQSWTPVLLLVLGVVFVPLLILLMKRAYLPIRDDISWKQGTVLALLAVAMFIMLASIFMITAFTDAANPLTTVLFVIVVVMVFAVYAAMLLLLRVGNERLVAQRQADCSEHLLRLQAQQINDMATMKQHDRRMRHDMRHALAGLRGFVAQGDTTAALDLIDEYSSSLPTNDTTRYCGNEAVNSLVRYYASIAKEQDVDLVVQIELHDALTISDSDLCVILGNLLDNAITAACQSDAGARWVKLGVASSGDAVSIALDNGFDGIVRKEGARYLTTKAGHSGLGLESIAYIAEKHYGSVEFSHDATVFRSSVLLRY